MANSYIPGTTNAILIGDNVKGVTPVPTKSNGDKVNACLELQTTTRAPIFMAPMTDAQIASIPNPTFGMLAASSTTGRVVWYNGTSWAQYSPASGINYASISMTAANIQGMSATPFQMLPAPGAGLSYLVHRARFTLNYFAQFGGGGAVKLQYGNASLAAGTAAVLPVAATFLTTSVVSVATTSICYLDTNTVPTITAGGTDNQQLTLSNATGPFTGGGASSLIVQIWYSVVTS